MFFEVWFWLLCALIVLPLPFKVYEYISGKDKSSTIVKMEEIFNALFLSIGLIGFYGYLNNESYLFSEFWFGWLFISMFLSIISIFWSPKLKYASDIMGNKKMKIMATIGLVFYLPLYFVIYQYALKT